MMDLRIISYNINGLRANIDKLRKLCEYADIIFLQELLVLPSDLHLLEHVHSDFQGVGVSLMDCENRLVRGRPVGGSGVLWRRSIAHLLQYHTPISGSETTGLFLNTDQGRILLLGTYFKPDYGHIEDLVNYEENLQSLKTVIENSTVDHILCVGDFNADVSRDTRFYGTLCDFVEDLGVRLEDVARLPSSSFTFLSPAHDTTSWLDHVIVSKALSKYINNLSVLYTVSESDHMPLYVSLSGLNTSEHEPGTAAPEPKPPRPAWGHATPEKIEKYKELTLGLAQHLKSFSLCFHPDCESQVHREQISGVVEEFSSGLRSAALGAIGNKTDHEQRSFILQGWNAVVKDTHREARQSFLDWRNAGSPRDGPYRDRMVSSRRTFKSALRRCKKQQYTVRNESLAHSLSLTNPKTFWNKIRKLSPKPNRPSTVEGVSGEQNIADLWGEHFSSLLGGTEEEAVITSNTPTNCDSFVVTAAMCREACMTLNSAATPGIDELAVSNFKLASHEIFEVLADIFMAIICHGFIPPSISDSVLIPIPKGHLVDLSLCSSYRGITVTSAMSKIFELVVAKCLADKLGTTHMQFGFKPHHSTLDAIFILKETINGYISEGSFVYAAFLDLHKAFDSVPHKLLLRTLQARGLPDSIVKLLSAWFESQRMCVRWDQSFSQWFVVKQGVRQGGCLSPVLFNVYLDGVLSAVDALPVGCGRNGKHINIIAYADDIVLLSPSLTGLQALVSLCDTELKDRCLSINPKKTVCISFAPISGSSRHAHTYPKKKIEVRGAQLDWVSSTRYLGVILEDDWSCNLDITRARRAFLASANMLTHRFSGSSLAVLQRLFVSFCYNFYGCEFWNSALMRDIRLLEVSVHNSCKRLLGLPPWASTRLASLEMGVLPLAQLLAVKRLMYLKRALQSPNLIVRSMIEGHCWSFSSFLRDSLRLCDFWKVTCINFGNTQTSDLVNFFQNSNMRSLEERPPYVS